MATLVLTTVGGAIGGPVGAAIGGVLGQAVDRRVLGPRVRQGPRLSDLKVQTSSYGTHVPKVFGTMRVAGCVIWSTELIETRATTRGGKGRPGTIGFSYAVSFAVALSARRIAGIGRIWAEGKLLRGAGGDWKVPTGFRWYAGGEEQEADPLIASLQPDAPAYRGIAYAVFENLPLGDFGNRIPSLSFEVIGDAAAPTIGAVATELGAGAVTGTGPAERLAGYAASGDSTAAALETLATIAGGWWSPTGGAVRLVAAASDPPRTIDADARVTERRQPIETVPRRVTVSCYDPARDHQIGVQQAQRPGDGGWRDMAHDLPVAMDAAGARGLAQTLLKRAERNRVTRQVTLDATAIDIGPGDAVRLGDGSGAWRVTRAEVSGRGVTLDLAAPNVATSALPADPGGVVAAPDRPVARTILVAAELPPLDDGRGEMPRIAVLAGGDAPGWRGAALIVSGDAGLSWEGAGSTAAPAIVGRSSARLDAGSTLLADRAATIEVVLAHDDMTLASVTAEALDRGANLAMLGEELLQFQLATQIAPRRWRLAILLRGRRGTKAAAHDPGTPFALIEDGCVAMLTMPRAQVGETIRILATGHGDAQPAAADVVLSGASIAPPAPVRVRALRHADGGATVTWVRRSRLGWRWRDGIDVPLGEEREAYAVTIGGDAGAPTLTSETTQLAMPASLLPRGAVPVAVSQLGTLARSAAAIGQLEGDGR